MAIIAGLLLLLATTQAVIHVDTANTVNGDIHLVLYRDHQYTVNISAALSPPEEISYYTLIGRFNTSTVIIDVSSRYREPLGENISIATSMNRTNQVIHYKKTVHREAVGIREYWIFSYTMIDNGSSLIMNGSIFLNTTDKDTIKALNISLGKLSLIKTDGKITTEYFEKNNHYISVINLEAVEIPRENAVSVNLADVLTPELQECIRNKLSKLLIRAHLKEREFRFSEFLRGKDLSLKTGTDSYIIPVYRGPATDSYLGIAPINTSFPYSALWTTKLTGDQLIVNITMRGLAGDKVESIIELVKYYHGMLKQGHKLVLKGVGILFTYDGEEKESLTLYPDTDLSKLSIKYVGEESGPTPGGGAGIDLINYIVYGTITLGAIVVIIGYLQSRKHT